MGEAAHITGAAPGGPRYDPDLTHEQRSCIDNGIWLCAKCATLVDKDREHYPAGRLREWREWAERGARLALEGVEAPGVVDRQNDMELIRFYAQCFDREAFQQPFMGERSVTDFDRAIEDTITAINTGCLRSRDGHVLAEAKGKVYLTNPDWRDKMDTVVDILRAIRSRYAEAIKSKEVYVASPQPDGQQADWIQPELGAWMDATRAQALRLFGELCEAVNVPAPVFPRPHWPF
ncbi:MAG TPA: HNH endonuclease [Armatimonadetes bacterium]|nr:HNH endonuclease [Armatimonadota bacterium]